MTDQSSTYTVAPVQRGDDEDEIMKLLERTFYIEEPLNAAVGLCAGTERCTELDEYCRHALHKGLSFKAVDSEGNIVGVVVSCVSPLRGNDNDLINEAQKCKNRKFQKILYILARRETAKLWEKFPDDESLLDVKLAATDPSWQRRGILNKLLKETEKAAEQRNIRLIRIDTSSAYSAKSAERLGYTCVYKARYADIKMDGSPLIVPEPPHEDDRVYIKKLLD